MIDHARRPIRSLALAGLLSLALLAAAGCHKSDQGDNAAAGGGNGTAPAGSTSAPAAPAPSAAPAAPLKVVALGIGKAVGPDNKVSGGDVDTFAPGDTFYAAVGTTGGPPATPAKLTVRWASVSHNGTEKPVGEETKSISPAGDATTEFHLAKAGGWPVSDYKVEILLDGQSVAVKAFRVAK